jgi:hypothetical protein
MAAPQVAPVMQHQSADQGPAVFAGPMLRDVLYAIEKVFHRNTAGQRFLIFLEQHLCQIFGVYKQSVYPKIVQEVPDS